MEDSQHQTYKDIENIIIVKKTTKYKVKNFLRIQMTRTLRKKNISIIYYA